jgi:hypothetical protein
MPEVKMKLKKNSSQIFPSPIGQHFSNLLGRSRKDPHSPRGGNFCCPEGGGRQKLFLIINVLHVFIVQHGHDFQTILPYSIFTLFSNFYCENQRKLNLKPSISSRRRVFQDF